MCQSLDTYITLLDVHTRELGGERAVNALKYETLGRCGAGFIS